MNISEDVLSTLVDDQNIRGYHDSCEAYHEYIRGSSVHRGNIMILDNVEQWMSNTLNFTVQFFLFRKFACLCVNLIHSRMWRRSELGEIVL